MKFVNTLPPKAASAPVSTRPGRYQNEADKLRSQPGRWALLKSFEKHGRASVLAHEIKRGKYVAFRPGGSFEAATRKRGDKHNVYVRYVGK